MLKTVPVTELSISSWVKPNSFFKSLKKSGFGNILKIAVLTGFLLRTVPCVGTPNSPSSLGVKPK